MTHDRAPKPSNKRGAVGATTPDDNALFFNGIGFFCSRDAALAHWKAQEEYLDALAESLTEDDASEGN